MSRWFLSYHSPEEALAEELKLAIERKDARSRVFFAPAHLRAGGFWQKALAEEIAAADAFILLVGRTGIGNWQELEYFAALDRRATGRFPLILLLLADQKAPSLPFLRQLHWIVTSDPTSEKDLDRLLDALAGHGSTPGELWRFASPYRGLAAMEEKDADYFFGREHETDEVLDVLAGAPDRLPVIIGNSGVGKSSLAQAGVISALKRQARPDGELEKTWPPAFADSRRWCFLNLKPGAEPLKALVQCFFEAWQFDATDPQRVKLQNAWIELLLHDDKTKLSDLLDATVARCKELGQDEPAAFFLYVDQGEELYVRADKSQQRRFSFILAQALSQPRFRALMSLRADFIGELQKDQALFDGHRQINLPPLRLEGLRKIVNRPAELLAAKFETDQLGELIAVRAAEESANDAVALPLLSYLLVDMWSKMVERGDGILRLPYEAVDLGRVLVERADRFLVGHPNAEPALRRILTLKLATVREDEEPTRRRAMRSEFSDEDWQLISELADHPNRLLVTVTSDVGETYAEVAHEALFRRWKTLRDWIAAEREFLAWKTGLEAARRAWEATPEVSRKDALLMGAALARSESWIAKRREDLTDIDRRFIVQSIARDKKAKARVANAQRLAYGSLVVIILGLVGVINQEFLQKQYHWWFVEWPYRNREFAPLTAEAEGALKPGGAFSECHNDCPEMIVLPAGQFLMGPSPDETASQTEDDGYDAKQDKPKIVTKKIRDRQQPVVTPKAVVIPKPFAVSKFDVTFAEWDACVRMGDCTHPSESHYGGGAQPVINISWKEAEHYAEWLSQMTGHTYRLLSEREWEYAARAGTTTTYYWGDAMMKDMADCSGCIGKGNTVVFGPVRVGSYPPNNFGLYDMAGNVWQWVEDCNQVNNNGIFNETSVPVDMGCKDHVARGGSWNDLPLFIRSSSRIIYASDDRRNDLGFRVARTLGP